MAVFAVIAVILILLGVILIMRKRKGINVAKIAPVLVLFFALFLFALNVNSASITWSGNYDKNLYYLETYAVPPTDSPYWCKGLGQTNFEVTYEVKAFLEGTNIELANNATVPRGTRVDFRITPKQNQHISFFGTGYSADSPYGVWFANAAYPGAASVFNCHLQETTRAAANCGAGIGLNIPLTRTIYTAFTVDNTRNPSIRRSAASVGASCNPQVTNCNLDTAGLFMAEVTFPRTSGKLYYGFTSAAIMAITKTNWVMDDDAAPVQIASPTPMRKLKDGRTFIGGMPDPSDLEEFEQEIPEQSIIFRLNVVAPTTPPDCAAMTVSGPPNPSVACENYAYGFRTTDAEGDGIIYNIDWDNDGDVDELLPSSGSAPSGVMQTANHIYPGAMGMTVPMTVKAFAKDDKGNISKDGTGNVCWKSLTINMNPCFRAFAGGPYNARLNTEIALNGTVVGGTGPYSYSWNFVSNGGSCVITSGANTLTPRLSCSVASSSVIMLTANDSSSPALSKTATANIVVNNPPVLTGGNFCINEGEAGILLRSRTVDEAVPVATYAISSQIDREDSEGETYFPLDCAVSSSSLRITPDFGNGVEDGDWCRVVVTDEIGQTNIARFSFYQTKLPDNTPCPRAIIVPPLVVDAGGPYHISSAQVGEPFELEGSVSGGTPFVDARGEYYDVSWSFLNSESLISPGLFSESTTPTPFIVANAFDVWVGQKMFQVVLTAQDNSTPVKTGSDIADVIVDSPAPEGGVEMTVSCSADPNPQFEGMIVTWTGDISGGTAPYQVNWVEGGTSIGGELTNNTQSRFDKSYNSPGNKKLTFNVVDNAMLTAFTECSVNIRPEQSIKCVDYGGTCQDEDICIPENNKNPVNVPGLCNQNQVCCVNLASSGSENSIVSLTGAFVDQSKIELYYNCKKQTNTATITLSTADGSYSKTKLNQTCEQSPTISKNEILDDDPSNPFPIDSMVTATLTIQEPCDVCVKSVTIGLTSPANEAEVPDNSLIALLVLIAFVSFIVSRKRIKTNNKQ